MATKKPRAVKKATVKKTTKTTKSRGGSSSKDGNWMAGAVKNPGGLHKSLGVSAGKKIPAKKVAAAAKKGGKVGRQARLAQTFAKFRRK